MTRAFPHQRARHCASGALRDLLEFHGLAYDACRPLTEELVFGLAGGLGFVFVELPEMRPPLYVLGRVAELEHDLCRHLGIGVDLCQTDDPEAGWELLRTELDRGGPTMIWVDVSEVDYLSARRSFTRHDVVVVDLDEANGIALIADNDRDTLQRCTLSALARARASTGFPSPAHHATWSLKFPDRLPPLGEAITAGVRTEIDNMRDREAASGAPPEACGLAGVHAFAARYLAWPEIFGAQLEQAMRGLRLLVVKAGTGGDLFRGLQARFLEQAATVLDDRRLAEAAAIYRQLADCWAQLGHAAGGDDALAAHATGISAVSRIAELEPAGIHALERWLEEPSPVADPRGLSAPATTIARPGR